MCRIFVLRTTRVVGLFLTLVLVFSSVGCGPAGGNGGGGVDETQWYVALQTAGGDDNNDCHTYGTPCALIATAIQRAKNGDTIHIRTGTYNESVAINESLTLIGEDRDATIIMPPENMLGAVVNVGGSGDPVVANISHLSLTNGHDGEHGGGVYVHGLTTLTLTDILIQKNSAISGGGIFADNLATVTLDQVLVSQNEAIGWEFQPQEWQGLGGGIYNAGTMYIIGGNFITNIADKFGGAIYNEGKLIISSFSSMSLNTAKTGGGIYNAYSGRLTLVDVTLEGNEAVAGGGGGMFNQGGAELTRVMVKGNTADTEGGGILNISNSDLYLLDSSIDGNIAEYGGGLANEIGRTQLVRVTISNNIANKQEGGGILNGGDADLTLLNVTVSANQAITSTGGGIAIEGLGSVTAHNVTIAYNQASNGAGVYYIGSGIAFFSNTIFAYNQGGNCNGKFWMTFNLSSDDTCTKSGYPNQVNKDPLLGPLQDNGGLTFTHALLSSSPAIDRGTDFESPLDDQRGVSRPVDGDADGIPRYDLGAYEYTLQTMSGSLELPGPVTATPPAARFNPAQQANCRSGPGTVYPSDVSAQAGVAVSVLGRTGDSSWYFVYLPEGYFCWLASSLGTFSGDSSLVPVREAPATPIPTTSQPAETSTPTPQVNCAQYITLETCNANPVCTWIHPRTGSDYCKAK